MAEPDETELRLLAMLGGSGMVAAGARLHAAGGDLGAAVRGVIAARQQRDQRSMDVLQETADDGERETYGELHNDQVFLCR